MQIYANYGLGCAYAIIAVIALVSSPRIDTLAGRRHSYMHEMLHVLLSSAGVPLCPVSAGALLPWHKKDSPVLLPMVPHLRRVCKQAPLLWHRQPCATGHYLGAAVSNCAHLPHTCLQIQLLRIQLRVPEYGWTTQKVFHLLNCLVCGLRAGTFLFREQMQTLHPDALRLVLFDLPGELKSCLLHTQMQIRCTQAAMHSSFST
jgi:hypothetical protein